MNAWFVPLALPDFKAPVSTKLPEKISGWKGFIAMFSTHWMLVCCSKSPDSSVSGGDAHAVVTGRSVLPHTNIIIYHSQVALGVANVHVDAVLL